MRTLLCIALLVVGCDPAPPGDAGVPLDAASCTSDPACDDGLFCNGEETCADGSCVDGSAPCAAACDEEADMCDDCVDEDGDGHRAIFCGGDDCADTDPNRFPGNPEVCDASHDEDCDPSTLGGDPDGDGFVAPTCCNGSVCGTDCLEGAIDVNPGATERCNVEDDDCDGRIDENSTVRCYQDRDNDGYALVGAPFMEECRGECPINTTARDPAESADCVDDDASINPGMPELCNRIDDDCSEGGGVAEAEDRDEDGYSPDSADCEGGPFPKGDCHDAHADVRPGQPRFFTEGFCGRSQCLCDGNCYQPPPGVGCRQNDILMTCLGQMVARSFDYNCRDGDEPRPATQSFGCGCFIGQNCIGSGPAPGVDRACGEELQANEWVSCAGGFCDVCNQPAEPNPGRMPCR